MNEALKTQLDWLAQALNDYAGTMPKAVREAFLARGQAALNQIGMALTPATAAETPALVDTTPRRRPRKPFAAEHDMPEPSVAREIANGNADCLE